MDYSALIQMATALYGEQAASAMTQQQLDLLKQQLANVQAVPLPNSPSVTPDQLGPSAVAGMTSNAGERQKQLDAISEIQQVIDAGGMDLTSKASLEDALSQANSQQNRARQGVANDLQSRGQLNSGANLVMSQNAAQSGANQARQAGTDAAAAASQRRLAAINDAAGLQSQLRGEDWSEADTANQAKDMRDERNANAREKAQYYNAGLPQQNFADAMQKAGAAGAPTGNLASAYQQAGVDQRQQAAGIGAIAGQAAGSGTYGAPTNTTTYTYNPDLTGDRGGAADLGKDPNDK